METKVCSICNKDKSLSEYYFTYKYIRKYCKKCDHKKRVNSGIKKKKFVVELLGGKCFECSLIDEYYMYDIDHILRADKTFEPSKMIGRRSKSLWIKEVSEKCQLLCANCHRRKSWKESQLL